MGFLFKSIAEYNCYGAVQTLLNGKPQFAGRGRGSQWPSVEGMNPFGIFIIY